MMERKPKPKMPAWKAALALVGTVIFLTVVVYARHNAEILPEKLEALIVRLFRSSP